jgi:hypothetical protein
MLFYVSFNCNTVMWFYVSFCCTNLLLFNVSFCCINLMLFYLSFSLHHCIVVSVKKLPSIFSKLLLSPFNVWQNDLSICFFVSFSEINLKYIWKIKFGLTKSLQGFDFNAKHYLNNLTCFILCCENIFFLKINFLRP